MSGSPSHHRIRSLTLIVALSTAMLATSLFAPSAIAAPGDDAALLDPSPPVVDFNAKVPPFPKMKSLTPASVKWPTPASAVIALPEQAGVRSAGSAVIGGLPVVASPVSHDGPRIPGSTSASTVPGQLRVEVVPETVAKRAGYPLTLRVSRADSSADGGAVRLEISYAQFRDAFGADWDNRLTLVTLPACALTTPAIASCISPTPLATTNNHKGGTLAADIDLAAGARSVVRSDKQAALEGVPAQSLEQEPLVVAVMAAGSSDIGDYTKTEFHPNYSWAAGGNSGSFTLSYPMQVPPVPGSLVPEVALNYSSANVDGQTVGVNVQPFWGEGWSYTPGYIERAYRSCKDEVANSPKYTITTTDNCWRLPNARMVLGGKAVELIIGNDGKWRAENDDAAKVELLTGDTETYNWNDEHWKVTTVDGTQYYFGLSRLPGWTTGDRETSSVLGMPVFSNHNGDPCIDAQGVGWTTSWCAMAYRWNLDYVVDRNGNTMSLWYSKETNQTAVAGNANTVTGYDRFGLLDRIEYGTRAGTGATRESAPNATPPARVVFTNANRCIAADCAPNVNWPDTPWDLKCDAAPCSNNMTPSFWSSKRVSQIATEVYSGSGTVYNRVDEWALGADFPADASGNPLWLNTITRTGKVGASKTLPSMQFFGTRMRNRADWDPNGTMADPMKYRITSLRNESGGQIDVTYSAQDTACQFGSPFPDPDNNDKRCFPRYWTNPTGSSGWAWWHKHTVTKVVEKDLVGGGQDKETNYSYGLEGASSSSGPVVLWAHDNGAQLFSSSTGFRSWADWRGYSTVTTTVGTVVGQQSQTKTLYFRGLNGDRTDNGYYARTASVTNSLGEVTNDEDNFSGRVHETQTLDGPGGQPINKTIIDVSRYLTGTRDMTNSWAIPPTQWSYIVRPTRERIMTWMPASSTWQTNETASQWNTTYGVIDKVDATGDPAPATTSDDVCTRYSYTFPAAGAPYLIDYPNRIEAVGVKCDTTPTFPQDALSDIRSFHDGAASYATAPTKGDVTKVEAVEKYVGATPTVIKRATTGYDQWGQVTSAKDGRDKETTTVYTQNTTGLTSTIKVTSPLAHEVISSLDVNRGLPLTVTDPNLKVTTATYDPLGRLLKAWQPGHPTSGTPDVEYQYELLQGAASYVRTRKLGPNGNQIDSYEFVDGFMRSRQAQETTPAGKRRITETLYDSRGFAAKVSIYNDSATAPTTTLASLADTSIDEQVRYSYDGAGRKTISEQYYRNTPKWKSTFTYGGDRTAIVRPTGGVHEQEIFDARGRMVKKRQFLTTNINGAFDETSYTYDRKGQLTGITDPAGKAWTYTYDLLGRKLESIDPDTGTSTFTYDVADRQLTSKDARNIVLAYGYDDLNRKTGVFEGSLGGTQRASWTYDTVKKGQLTSASRIDGANTYTSSVNSYDEGYRPLSTTYTVPGFGAGGTTLTYTVGTTYKTNGELASQTLPGIGGLSSETINYAYSTQGMPTTVGSGLATYVSSTSYAFDGLTTQQLLGPSGTRLKLTSSYDAATRRLTNQSVATETTTVNTYVTKYSTDYGYDQAGNVTSAAGKTYNGTSLVADQEECFRYDYLRRLTEAWTQVSGSCTTAQRTGADPYWRQWTIDTTGNRKTQKDIDSTAGNTDWTYTIAGTSCGSTGKPHQVTGLTATGPKAGTGSRTFCYDAAGNMTSRTSETGAAQTLTWDKEGRLATLVQGANTYSYVYDADGNRLIAKDPTSGDTLYLPDGTEVKKLTGGQIEGTRYYSRGGNPFAVRKGTALTYVATDGHGTGYAQVDASTLATARRRNLPYGEARGTQPTWVGTKGFINGTTDPTGLTHLGVREYDPTLGRFISADPLLSRKDPRTLNPYAYGNNSPSTFVDPDGRYFVEGLQECGCGTISVTNPLNGIFLKIEKTPSTMLAISIGIIVVVGKAISGLFNNEDTSAEGAARAAGIHGTQEGAEELQGVAKELNDTRVGVTKAGNERTFDRDRGTVAVVKVWDAVTGKYIIKVAVENEDIASMPEGWEEIIRKTVGNEIAIEFVRNKARADHAEKTIVDSLGKTQVIVEGGTSRNVCKDQCGKLLTDRDVTIGGRAWPFRGAKTDHRTFWRSNSYPSQPLPWE